MHLSARNKFQLPDLADGPADLPAVWTAAATVIDKFSQYDQGLLAARPVSTGGSPGIVGRKYLATDDLTAGPDGTVHLDLGTSWIQLPGVVPALSITNGKLADDSVNQRVLAPSSVGSPELIDLGIATGDLADKLITSGKVADALKPSAGAGAGTEALRAIGAGAGQVLGGDDTRIPTQGENDAQAGTSGAPGNANRYVTDADARNTNARTPTAHKTSHEPGGSDALTLLDNSSLKAGAGVVRSKLDFGSGLVNADIAAAAALAYSKLNLTNAILNADIAAAAAIAYSKLNLANAIVNGDIAAAAAIAYSKLNLANSIVHGDVAAANKDGAAATPSMRTLGTGAAQAAAGNDARIIGDLNRYFVIARKTINTTSGAGVATYLAGVGQTGSTTLFDTEMIPFEPGDFTPAIAGMTAKYRIVSFIQVNAVAMAGTGTVLCRLEALNNSFGLSGGASGVAPAGSGGVVGVTKTALGANSETTDKGADTNAPAAGKYGLSAVIGVAALPAGCVLSIVIELQARYV